MGKSSKRDTRRRKVHVLFMKNAPVYLRDQWSVQVHVVNLMELAYIQGQLDLLGEQKAQLARHGKQRAARARLFGEVK